VDLNEEIYVLNINNVMVADSSDLKCTAMGQERGSAHLFINKFQKLCIFKESGS
jgi:hypothetical protein